MNQHTTTFLYDSPETLDKLKVRGIPFQEVILHTSEGPRPGIRLSETSLILITAGQVLTDN